MFMAEQKRPNPPVHIPFVATKQGFTYLGVKIPPTINEIIPANYKPLIESVTQLINRWTKLPISLIGRINNYKMTILPKLLYIFQSIPLSPLPSSFQLLKKTFTTNDQELDSLYYIYHMTEVGFNYQTLFGISGQLKLELGCVILKEINPQRWSLWNPSCILALCMFTFGSNITAVSILTSFW